MLSPSEAMMIRRSRMRHKNPVRQARICLMATVIGLALSGCGKAENATQTVATLVASESVLKKGMDATKPVDHAHSPFRAEDRYVAFESSATDLVSEDTNGVTDVFVYDRRTKQAIRVSVNSIGTQANGGSFAPEVTRDGRFVTFESLATNLVPHDTNRQRDVFINDLQTGKTTRVSVNSDGTQGNNFSQAAHLNADGRYVVFESLASNLVSGDTNGVIDVFVYDRQSKRTTRVSVASGGMQANNMSVNPSISADGRFVTFETFATNLSPNKADGRTLTFVHDRKTGETRRAPVDSASDVSVIVNAPRKALFSD